MDLRNGFDIKRYIRTIPDYPKPGIMFRDITTLLSNLHGFRAAVDELAWPFLKGEIDYVAGIEARGWRTIWAAASFPFARRANCPLR